MNYAFKIDIEIYPYITDIVIVVFGAKQRDTTTR